MIRIKALIRFLFGFSRTETNAFLVLLPLMLIVIVSEPVYQTYFMSNYPDDFKDRRELDSLVAVWQMAEPLPNENLTKGKEKLRDSLKSFQSKRKFISRKPYKNKNFLPRHEDASRFRARVQLQPIDLNLADTSQLKTIYGIGPTLAKRIILYRTNLGGFVASDQLYEVWGLDSTVVTRLTSKSVIAPDFTPNKLAINHCSEQDLAHHPYLRTKLARAIVNYRFQHGNFDSVDDLKKIGIMEEKVFLRIKPYITLD
jgi:DNA uptake protein ComE-like DNA-binding protein